MASWQCTITPVAFALVVFAASASSTSSKEAGGRRKRVQHVLEGPFLTEDTEMLAQTPRLILSEGLDTSTGEWTGHRIWPSAVALVQHLHQTLGAGLVGLRVLELGCGLPLVGASLAALGAEVCATDHPDMLPFVEEVLANDVPGRARLTGLSAAARGRLRLRPLLWGENVSHMQADHSSAEPKHVRNLTSLCDFAGPVDLVIGADLIYAKFPVQALQETLIAALRTQGATAVLALQPRRFPQRLALEHPHLIAEFLRQLAAQPGGWEVVVKNPVQDAIAQARDRSEGMLLATITPPSSRTLEQCTKVVRPLTYLQEELRHTVNVSES